MNKALAIDTQTLRNIPAVPYTKTWSPVHHAEVMDATDMVLAGLGIQPQYTKVETSKNGMDMFATINLPAEGKRDSLIVVAQLCPEFTARIVDRWQELEERAAKPIDPMAALSDPATMRGLLLTYTEKVLFLESTVAEQAPKVEALERFANHEGKHNLRSATKLLGVQEHKLKSWLLIHKWYYRDHSGRLCAYADKIAAGYLDAVPVEVPRSDGVQVVQQPVITQKGLTKLAELLARDGLLPKEAA